MMFKINFGGNFGTKELLKVFFNVIARPLQCKHDELLMENSLVDLTHFLLEVKNEIFLARAVGAMTTKVNDIKI